jgi:hypothetical protein
MFSNGLGAGIFPSFEVDRICGFEPHSGAQSDSQEWMWLYQEQRLFRRSLYAKLHHRFYLNLPKTQTEMWKQMACRNRFGPMESEHG